MNLIALIGKKKANKEFAIKSFKYTIELVNDEEDEVRFTTIKCLEILIKNFKIIDVCFFLKKILFNFFNFINFSSNHVKSFFLI